MKNKLFEEGHLKNKLLFCPIPFGRTSFWLSNFLSAKQNCRYDPLSSFPYVKATKEKKKAKPCPQRGLGLTNALTRAKLRFARVRTFVLVSEDLSPRKTPFEGKKVTNRRFVLVNPTVCKRLTK